MTEHPYTNEDVEAVKKYVAEHQSPDLDKLIGNPTVGQYVAYVRKAIVNVLNVVVPATAYFAIPNPAGYYVSGAIGVLGWIVHYNVTNGPKPPVRDKTGWVDAATPPKSDKVPPTEDVITEPTADEPPAMSKLDADAQLEVEDRNAQAATHEEN